MDPTSTGRTLLRDTDNLQTDLDWAVDTASTDHMLDRPGCPTIPPNAPRTAPPMCRSGTVANRQWSQAAHDPTPKAPYRTADHQRAAARRMIRCTSAVLGVRRPIASRFGANSLVTMLRAGTGTRTPGLLITSNPAVSAVLSGPIAGGRRNAAERRAPSYQLNLRPSRH
jgi:hypothetical protein